MMSFLKVTIESMSGISIGVFDRCLRDQVPQEPMIAAHFFQKSWEKYCNDFQISSKGVTFSDAKPSEFGFARILFRDRNRIDCETGTSSTTFSEILIQGQLEFVIHCPKDREYIENFLYFINEGIVRIGKNGSNTVIGKITQITEEEANTFETTQPSPKFEPEKCDFNPSEFGLTAEDAPELRNELIRLLHSCFSTREMNTFLRFHDFGRDSVLNKESNKGNMLRVRDILWLSIQYPDSWKGYKPREFFPWFIKKVEEIASP